MRHIHSYSRDLLFKNKRARNTNTTIHLQRSKTICLQKRDMQQNKWMQNNGRRRVHRMYCKRIGITFFYIIGISLIIITLLIGCSHKKRTCWISDERTCIPIKTYTEWNKCISDCSNVTINSKTKPYKPIEWIRPRPYVYP